MIPPVPNAEGVAWSHAPALAHRAGFSPALAVHVANGLDRCLHQSSPSAEDEVIAEDLLARLGFEDRLPVWRKQCQEIEEKQERGFHG